MPSSFYNLLVINHVPRKKGVGSRESGRHYREILRECASYVKLFPRGQRFRAYRECIESKLKASLLA